jgi:predicted Zn-dependent protease
MFEGGDPQLGLRLYRAAYYLGVADPGFYHDAIELSKLLRREGDAIVLYREHTRRWPNDSWGWTGLAKELEKRGLRREAAEARRRAAHFPDSARPLSNVALHLSKELS